MKLQKTNHSYYCSESNYYVSVKQNYGRSDYRSWDEFKNDWIFNGEFDDDLNHLFRFDIFETEGIPGNFSMHLYFMLQRKGIFRPVIIENITQEDVMEIEVFLKDRWTYMQRQWEEFSHVK